MKVDILQLFKKCSQRLHAAAGGPATDPKNDKGGGEKEATEAKKKKQTRLQRVTAEIVRRQYTQEYARKVLDNFKELGFDREEDIRKMFVARGMQKLVPRAVSRSQLNHCPAHM